MLAAGLLRSGCLPKEISAMQSNSRSTPSLFTAERFKTSHFLRQWIGTAVLVGGSAIVSVFQSSALSWHVFAAFLFGHLVLVFDSFIAKHNPYLALNASLAALDIYAIVIRHPGLFNG